jgi:predicted kinase
MARGRLFIVCGLPGSGKTNLARQLERKFNAVRFCPDEWLADLDLDVYDEARRSRVEALQWRLAQSLLLHGHAVIIEWGTWARSERDALRTRAREIGAAVELHYLTAPIDVLYERIRQRGVEKPAIQISDLQQWAAIFQSPTTEEVALFDCPQPE